MPDRRSDRQNKGKKPAHLNDFITEIEQETDESDQSDDLDQTILTTENEMANDNVEKSQLERLLEKFVAMKTELIQKNEEMQLNFQRQKNELHAKLDATNKELASVQKAVRHDQRHLHPDPPILTEPVVEPTFTPSSTFNVSPTMNRFSEIQHPILSNTPLPQNSQTLPTSITTPATTNFSSNIPQMTTDSSSGIPPPTTTPGYSENLQQMESGYFNPSDQMRFGSFSPFPVRKHLVALPKFDGNPAEWLVFLAEYKRTTAEFKYTSSENPTRLNECLKGRARELVQWLLVHNDLADKIIDRLKSRYGRPELLIDAQTSMLKAIPKICDSKVEQIVPFADKVVNFSHCMLSSSNGHYLRNPTLLNELVMKLPMNTRIVWATHISSFKEAPSILDFSDWLEVLADNIAKVTIGVPTQTPKKMKYNVQSVTRTIPLLIALTSPISHMMKNGRQYLKRNCVFLV